MNLGEVWQKRDVPVLVIRGSSDDIMSRADNEAIAQIVNQTHPGRARYLEIPGMTHGMTISGKFYDDLIPTVLNWISSQLDVKK